MGPKNRAGLKLIAFLLISLSFYSCDTLVDLIFDTEAPTAYILSPANETTVSIDSDHISIKVVAHDDRWLTWVGFYVDSLWIGERCDGEGISSDSGVYYEYQWDLADFADCSPHLVYAIAGDKSGNTTMTTPIYVTVTQEYYAESDHQIYDITESSAIVESRICCDNGIPVIERGVCWSLEQDPTIADPASSDGYGLGDYTSLISDLSPDTLYNVRAFATNNSLTFYGNNVQLMTAPVDFPDYEMVFVEGDTFMMGNIWDSSSVIGNPAHEVSVEDYYIGKYELTQNVYVKVMEYNPSVKLGRRIPVFVVRWIDAIEFCNAYSLAKGLDPVYTIGSTSVTCDFDKNGYRLPTEAEWEFAARGGGKDNRQWSGTNYISAVNNYAQLNWYNYQQYGMQEVGGKLPNDLELYDMTGNVYEWCWENYYEYTETPRTNPQTRQIDIAKAHIIRGGDMNRSAKYSTTCYRRTLDDARAGSYAQNVDDPWQLKVGFRMVRKADSE